MGHIQKKIIALVASVLLLPAVVLALNTIDTGFQIAHTTTAIDAHGVCQQLFSTDGKTYFVPTKTSNEWSIFRTQMPAAITASSCQMLQNATWENLGQILPGPIANSQSMTVGGYVYLFGGRTSSTGVTNAIYRASTAAPASWTSVGSLPGPVHSGQLYSDGAYIYLFGGRSGETAGDGTFLNTIYRASVSNPLSWSNTGYTLPSKLAYSQLVVPGDGFIYLLGGSASYQTYNNVIYRAPISNPLSWANTGATLPVTLGTSQAYVYGGYMYLFGGRTANNVYTSTIYRAATSNPLAWTAAGTLPFSMAFGTVEPIGDSLYFFGGYNGSSSAAVYKASFSNLLSWSLVAGNLPTGFDSTQAEIIGNHVYLISGGTDAAWATRYVYRARVQ